VPNSGRVVRVTSSGQLEPIATGLMFPTAMTFGPDGNLYVSNCGFLCPPGKGEVDRITVPAAAPPALPTTGGENMSWVVVLAAGGALLGGGWLLRLKSKKA